MKEVQWIDPDFLAPKDAWDRLSMKEKAAMMKVAVQNGITNLSDIRAKYNEFAEGGDTDWSYNNWKKQIAEHMGIRPDEDNTYDYEAYFNKYPEEAWKMLKGDPTAHFSDEFKTVYHPTFSSKSIDNDGSIYSGIRNPKTNPQGLAGGTWSPDYNTFTMSPDGYRGPVSMDDRKWYLENAEDNGVVLREADGSLPIYDGIPWGGVLPNVTVYGNKHAEGGNLFRGGGSIVSDKLVDMTIKEEGFNKQPEDIGDGKMTLGSGLTASKWHDLYRKRGNKWSAADNRMAVRQELSDRERWAKSNIPNWKGLPDSSKEALLMYKYNYDFNRANSPKLFAALEAGNLPEAARQMDATSKDPKFKKGLANRRKREQAHFMLGVRPTSTAPNDIALQSPDNTFVYNPYFLQEQNTTMLPQVVPDEDTYVSTHEVSPEEIRAQRLQESFDNINRFNRTMEMLGNNLRIPTFHPTTGNDVLDLLWATRGNDSPLLQMADEYARGGKIHIKEKNRGKFTRLKERTGKSASWFKAHGTPAQKKMAVFALNSRKWKHGLGGNLFSGEEDHSSQMNIGLNATNGWQPYTLGVIVANGERAARQRKTLQDTFLNFPVESNDATAVANGRPQNTHLEEKAVRGGTANAAWEREHPGLAQLGYAASAVPFAVASAPLLGATAETGAGQTVTAGLGWLGDAAVSSPLFINAASRALGTSTLLPWLDAGMTAGFGAHGIQETAEGNFTPMTAFEIAPLWRLAKPIAKEAALAVENYRYPLGRPQVSEDFLTVNPQVRTRVGDVEIDNPNLLYHLDRGDRTGAFSNQGAYAEDGVLFPGTPKDDTAIPYSWWNKGKPYADNVGGQPMTRLMTTTEDAPGMLHVRSQNYPIGQWNGRRGFVTNAEYVDPEGVDVSGSTYTLDPDYGWRRVFAEETPAAEWAQTGKSNRSPLTLSEEELQEEMERWAMEELGDGPYYRASSYKDNYNFFYPEEEARELTVTANPEVGKNNTFIGDETWDAAYNAALARGDMAEAKRLSDAHFLAKAPNTVMQEDGHPLELYRGERYHNPRDGVKRVLTLSNNGRKSYTNHNYSVLGKGERGEGVYLSSDGQYAKQFAGLQRRRRSEPYLNFANEDYLGSYYVNADSRTNVDFPLNARNIEEYGKGHTYDMLAGHDTPVDDPNWYNSTGEEFVVKNPKNVKLSDAVTYDDAGNPIPLSQRHDFSNPDSRYQLTNGKAFSRRPWTAEDVKAASEWQGFFFENDVIPRLRASRKDLEGTRFIKNSPFLGKFELGEMPRADAQGITAPFIKEGKSTMTMNVKDMSSLEDKFGTVIHEAREDMINYHLGLYEDLDQEAFKYMQELDKALAGKNVFKAARLLPKYKKMKRRLENAYLNKYLTQEEKDAIQAAYKTPKNPQIENSGNLNEKVSENTRCRAEISRRNGNVIGEGLDKIIDRMSDDEILDILSTGRSYGQDYRQFIEENPKERTEMIQKIKNALKKVGVFAGVGYTGLTGVLSPKENKKQD